MSDKRRRILVISYFFAPHKAIASIRWSKLAKYMVADGWDVDVITTSQIGDVDTLLARDYARLGNVIHLDHSDKHFMPTAAERDNLEKIRRGEYRPPVENAGSVNTAARPKSALAALKQRIVNSAPVKRYSVARYVRRDEARSRDFADLVIDYIKSHGGLSQYDAVVSSFGPVADVYIAMRLKKLYPDTPVIIDFRDQMDCVSQPPRRRKRFGRLQRRVCQIADAVCTVSNGVADGISPMCPSDTHIQVIYNGCDPEDFEGIEVRGFDRFTICLTGSIYTALCDLTPLWRCLRSLIDSHEIDIDKIALVHAGRHGQYLAQGMAAYGLESILECLGTVGRTEALSLQRSADALLLTVWNNTGSTGIVSGKTLEYIYAQKPIIALINGDIGNSEVRQIIEEGEIGCAHESVTAEADDARLRDYILSLYNARFNGTESVFRASGAVSERFEYPALAKEYEALIESTIAGS